MSNFKPSVAKAIVGKYSSEGDVVVDFAAGYGGRLVGCLTLGRRYVGIEPCESQVRGLLRTLRVITRRGVAPGVAEVWKGCAEEELKLLRRGSVGLVFSSPPYYDWEKYASQPTQSFLRYKTYESWVKGFLVPVLRESRRILRKEGFVVLNVSDGRRRPTWDEVIRLGNNLGLRKVRIYRVVMPKVPYLHPRNGSPEKSERIIVFSRG